ncbi:hypothetical protein TNCV_3871431 [Trichonephila clavipes]|nr:hypothetical protein TNCV_3871431 [Trichonephila clavipes]
MPIVSAPCSCQPDCLVCGRGEVPPHDCAIHVLLELMVFQERMLPAHPKPLSASLSSNSEPIKSHFLLLSSLKAGLGSQLPHRHGGRPNISSIPDQIPGSASL